MKDYTKKPWKKFPLEKLKVPRNGALCRTGLWWIVTPDKHVLFYKGSPQCNISEAITKSIRDRIHIGCDVEYMPVSFVDHDCHDYVF